MVVGKGKPCDLNLCATQRITALSLCGVVHSV